MMQKVLVKSASMKPRGVAFAVESISQVPGASLADFNRLENVVLSKVKEFVPHFLVKILTGFCRVQ